MRTKVNPRRHPKRTPQEKAERKRDRERRHRLQRPFFATVEAVFGRLPLPVAAVIGDALGLASYWFSTKARTRVVEQVTLAYGDTLTPRERRRIGRGSLRLMARGLASFVRMARLGTERSRALLDVVGEDETRRVIAESGGAIFFSAHYGMLELAAIDLTHRFDASAIQADTREGTSAGRLTRLRAALGARTIQRGDPRELTRALKSGKPVGMVVDHDIAAIKGVFVPFFGRLSHTVIGPGTFAARLGIPMICIRIEWISLTRHRIHYGPALFPRTDLPKAEAALELMARVTRLIEAQIRERPDHWMWLHRRWATTIEDAPDLPVWREETP